MVYVVLAIALVAIAAIIAAMVELGQRDAARAELATAAAERDGLRVQLEQAQRQGADTGARLEAVIASLKSEIATLEGDLDAIHDPGVVRDRLRRLLSPGAGAGGGPGTPGLPASPAAR